MELADLPPPNKQATFSAVTIEQLPSPMLTKIFSYLPFKDRYVLILVSSKWAEISRVPWTDITFLDLASIPRAMVDPILSLSPRLVTIEASHQTIVLEETPHPTVCENVRTMRLHEVSFAGMDLDPLAASTVLITQYFERFPRLAELILYDCKSTDSLPQGADLVEAGEGVAAAAADAMLTVLLLLAMPSSAERLILTQPYARGVYFDGKLHGSETAECLPQLRELCLVDIGYWPVWLAEAFGGAKFPNLEVLVYASHRYIEADSLSQLITAKMPLRILVIAGKGATLSLAHIRHDLREEGGFGYLNEVQYPIILPPRQFPLDSADGDKSRYPPLQIFVGGDFTKHVRFTLPKTEAANFWRIDCPMPEYLAKPEVAAIFKDVWVAKVLREGPENGLLPWGHPDQTELFFSTEPLFFVDSLADS